MGYANLYSISVLYVFLSIIKSCSPILKIITSAVPSPQCSKFLQTIALHARGYSEYDIMDVK